MEVGLCLGQADPLTTLQSYPHHLYRLDPVDGALAVGLAQSVGQLAEVAVNLRQRQASSGWLAGGNRAPGPIRSFG
jgi:hypothetical protein